MLPRILYKSRRFSALCILLLAFNAGAQESLSPAQAVELAWHRASMNQQRDASLAAAQADVLTARLRPNPILTVARDSVIGADNVAGNESTVMVSQMFELGGRRDARIRAASAGIPVADAAASVERAELRAEVLRHYAGAAAAEGHYASLDTIINGLNSLTNVASKRFRGGDLSGYESRRIALALSQADSARRAAATDALNARTRLSAFIGDTAMTARFQGDFTNATGATRNVHPGAMTPETALLAARRDHAEALANAAATRSVPVTVGLGAKHVRQGQLSDNLLLMEVGVPLPIFDRNQGERARTAAQVQLLDSQLKRRMQFDDAQKQSASEQAKRYLNSATELESRDAPEAARLTAIARNSFAEGEMDLTGLLDAYRNQMDILERAFELRQKAIDAALELERLKPISVE